MAIWAIYEPVYFGDKLTVWVTNWEIPDLMEISESFQFMLIIFIIPNAIMTNWTVWTKHKIKNFVTICHHLSPFVTLPWPSTLFYLHFEIFSTPKWEKKSRAREGSAQIRFNRIDILVNWNYYHQWQKCHNMITWSFLKNMFAKTRLQIHDFKVYF